MVVEPCKAECRNMERILSIPDHPRQLKDSNAPEQDFLSMHFGEHWVSMPVKFNWQPHQIRYLFAGRLFDPGVVCDRKEIINKIVFDILVLE